MLQYNQGGHQDLRENHMLKVYTRVFKAYVNWTTIKLNVHMFLQYKVAQMYGIQL